MESHPQWVVLARILRPQGRKGEVLADLFTDFPDRFADRPQVWLAPAEFAESAAATTPNSTMPAPAEVASHWLPLGRNAGRIVLQFSSVDSIEAAEKLSGKEVLVPRENRLPLDEDAAYISDLIGCTVYDRDKSIGVVEDLQFPATPDGLRRLADAAPLLSIRSAEGDEILVPFVKKYLVKLDLPKKEIWMALPEGLIEINQPQARRSERD